MTPDATLYRPYAAAIGHPAGCKCDTCRAAVRFNDKMFRYGKRRHYTYSDLKPHAERIVELVGGSVTEVTAQTGIWPDSIYAYLNGGDSIVPARSAAKFFSIKLPDLKYKPKSYPSAHLIWRVGVLAANGYPKPWVARRAGLHTKRLYPQGQNVGAVTWEAVDAVWRKHKDRMADPTIDGILPAHITRAKNFAARSGFHPFAAYENEFDAEPSDTTDMEVVLREDRDRLDLMIAARIRVGIQPRDIIEELTKLNPDFDLETAVDRTRARLRRNPRWGLSLEGEEDVTD